MNRVALDFQRNTRLTILLAGDIFHRQLQTIGTFFQLLRQVHLIRDEIVSQVVT